MANQSFSRILSQKHKELEQQAKILKRTAEAEKIEQYLRFLKTKDITQLDQGTFFSSIDNHLISQTKDYLNKIIASKGVKNKTLFKKSEGRNHASENDLANIIATTINQATGKEDGVKAEDFKQGQGKTGKIALNNIPADILEKILKNLGEKVPDYIYQAAQKGKQITYTLKGVEPKIDIGPSGGSLNIPIQTQLTPGMQDVIRLLQTCNFQIKNYIGEVKKIGTKTIGYNKLSLGHVTNKRLFISVFGNDLDKFQSISYQSKDPKARENINLHTYHVRQIYELIGLGQSNGIVDFLIYNDYNSENIIVRDTGSLMIEILNSEPSVKYNFFSGQSVYRTTITKKLKSIGIAKN